MHPLPHHYSAAAVASVEEGVTLQGNRLPPLSTETPEEFGGPGDRWSPETLLVGAIADCFVLTFRGIARNAKLAWTALRCDVEGTLDRIDSVTQFTRFLVRASLEVPSGTNKEEAERLLERTERLCLIINSLKGRSRLETSIEVRPQLSRV